MKKCLLTPHPLNEYTIKHVRKRAIEHLLTSPFLSKIAPYSRKDAILDVDVLLSFVLKKSKAYLLAHLDEEIFEFKDYFDNLLEQRYAGISIAYIIKEKEFYGISFYVSNRVLIPKSDTEVLLDIAVEEMQALLHKRATGEKKSNIKELNILDVFSGSGCLGIATVYSLLSKLGSPNQIFQIFCSFLDISSEAIEVSCFNAKKLLPVYIQKNLSFFCQDAREIFPLKEGKKYDLILANPPYVSQKETEELLSDGRGEPALALNGGEDGLAFFPTLAKNAHEALKEGGLLFCEIGDGQCENVVKIFLKAGFINIECYSDLSQKERVLKGEKRL